MAHAPARRRGAAGNESDHGFPAPALGLIGEELGGIFLSQPPISPIMTITWVGGLVGQEPPTFDELGALHRIAADADGGIPSFLDSYKHNLLHPTVGVWVQLLR